jgi:FkbM family methyltransferase
VYLDVSESVMMLMRVLRLYEPEKHRVLQAALAPGMTFVDVGACKGDFTLLAAASVGPQGRVVAVEPEPVNASWLRRSVGLSAARNVEVMEMALGDASGRAVLHRVDVIGGADSSSGLHSLLEGGLATHDTIEVDAQTLDGLLGTLGIARVDVIKIDVEGWEVAVLRGAAGTLTRQRDPPVILIDLHPDLGVDPLEVADILREYGYETLRIGSPDEPLDVRGDTDELRARPRRSVSTASKRSSELAAVTRRRNRGYAVRSIDAIARSSDLRPAKPSGVTLPAVAQILADRQHTRSPAVDRLRPRLVPAVHAAEATLTCQHRGNGSPQFAAVISSRPLHLLGLCWLYPYIGCTP